MRWSKPERRDWWRCIRWSPADCIIDSQVVNPVVVESLRGRKNSLIYGMEARAGIEPFAKFPQYDREFWNLEMMPKTLNRQKGDTVGQRQIDLLRKAMSRE